MKPLLAAEGVLDRHPQPSGGVVGNPADSTSSASASALRSLHSLLEGGDFEELSDFFFRICKEGDSAQGASKLQGASRSNSAGAIRLYFGGTRPSSASTSVPSSSLSLSSTSMEHSAPSDIPQEPHQSHGECEFAGDAALGICHSGNTIATKRLEDEKDENKHEIGSAMGGGDERWCPDTPAANCSHPLADAASCTATPRKAKEAAPASSEETKTWGKTHAAESASASLARRSPRLQRANQGTPRHEPMTSPASKKQCLASQQQPRRGEHSSSKSSTETADNSTTPGGGGGKRQQATASGGGGGHSQRKRGRGELDSMPMSPPTGCSSRSRTNPTCEEAVREDAEALSPMKGASNKRKGSCRSDAAKASSGKKPSSAAQAHATHMSFGGFPETERRRFQPVAWCSFLAVVSLACPAAQHCNRKKARVDAPHKKAVIPREASPAQSQDVSEADDEPICRFALPSSSKEDAVAAADSGPPGSCNQLVELSHTSVAAVQQEETCAEEELREDGGDTPGEPAELEGALQHKVLRALPKPTPQFDFGLFIVRVAAMSKHADDIFPLLEDEELMETSIVLQKYLGPLKEGAKRRGDCFMLDKLVADIPNQGGVYRPSLDIKEAPWCTGLDADEGKVLPKKEVLRQRIEIQRRWNPFSIFGSSPPAVELEDVFGYEVYQRTAPSARVHHPLFRRLSQFQSFKDLYSSISKEEWDRVSSAFRHHWNKQCRLDLDWTNDPLTVDEIMWMLEANEQAPRPSMGCHILTQPPLVDDSFEDQEGENGNPGLEPRRRQPSSSASANLLTATYPCEASGKPQDGKHEEKDSKQKAVVGRCESIEHKRKHQGGAASSNAFPLKVCASHR
ncbi:uncharacterized protein LOC34619971 [Cyclospora cayetanensis]|uniref:Uncharacterized protein LOC34619971 n=1 Tax=Cyclospora cayetanensis TaxID=88456 RepID=A0A6P6RT13_9EIME|nr:uncharacterized protein LOC34619971 [Cyclospora cayetanensis]